MPILESEIESKVTVYAIKKGCLSIKLAAGGVRGWADRLYISPRGGHLYIEFKRPGGHLRKLQQYRLEQLRDHNCSVAIVWYFEDGKELIDELVDPA